MCVLYEIPHLGECTRLSLSGPDPRAVHARHHHSDCARPKPRPLPVQQADHRAHSTHRTGVFRCHDTPGTQKSWDNVRGYPYCTGARLSRSTPTSRPVPSDHCGAAGPEATCFAHESPPVCDDVGSHPKYPGALVMGNRGGRCEAIWLWGVALYAARETGRYIPIPDAGMQKARDPRPRHWLGGTSSEIAVLGAGIRASADASRIRTARGVLELRLR